MTSRGSPRPEQAGQSLDPGESASRRARNRYSRVTAEAQVGNTEDSRDTRGGRPGLRAVQALDLVDLSSLRLGGLVSTKTETWAETPSSGADVFTPGN